MDERPIGVFDSGLGGLTTVKKLSQFLPGEDIIYLGDTGRAPYGPRSDDTIRKYARQDAAFLASFGVKAMVAACNTVCSAAYGALAELCEMPLYGVIGAPSEAAATLTKNRRIGVIGTSATIRSGAYEKAVKEILPEAMVISVACPLFVPLVENGRTGPDDAAALAITEDYLSQLREDGIDTLILGCTHYPMLKGVISKIMGPGITLVDSGEETAKLVATDMRKRGILSSDARRNTIKYYVTDSVDGFAQLASRFLETDVSGNVLQISLEQ